MKKVFNQQKHPELKPGEMWITNISQEDLNSQQGALYIRKSYKSLRMGEKAYDQNGTVDKDYVPLFVAKNEYKTIQHKHKTVRSVEPNIGYPVVTEYSADSGRSAKLRLVTYYADKKHFDAFRDNFGDGKNQVILAEGIKNPKVYRLLAETDPLAIARLEEDVRDSDFTVCPALHGALFFIRLAQKEVKKLH